MGVLSLIPESPGTGAAPAVLQATLEQRIGRISTMDEQSFRLFYDRTARPLQRYLVGATGDRSLAEDLLQESYLRLLRADVRFNDETHRRSYLFRIAANLLRDRYRRRRPEGGEPIEAADPADHGAEVGRRADLGRVLGELKPRERQLLWLAYVEGMSHQEIAAALGLKEGSIRPLLFRARRRMAAALHARGWTR